MTRENLADIDIVVTCRLGMEKVVASYIKELDPQAVVIPSPRGLLGMVLVKSGSLEKERLAHEIRSRVPEAEKVFVVEAVARADVNDIVSKVLSVVKGRISEGQSFAVRTVRRGKHSFTSIDVNVAVGAAVKDATGARVDLENPDKVVVVQIVHEYAYISLVDGREFWKKMRPGKFPMYKLFRLISVAHEPYLGPPDASYTMGRRIGREVQTYEVGELVVAPIGKIEATPLYHFLRGLFEGIESRYEIQRRSYGREVHRVRVYLQDMYQFVRSRMGEVIIVFEPEGEPISRVSEELSKLVIDCLRKGRRINVLVGAREGVPTGIFRFATMVLDVAPGVVISTDYALASALIALATVLHEHLVRELSSDGVGEAG